MAVLTDDLSKLRHTTEHVLHQAMVQLYPGLKPAMGPATDDGFYFDFDYDGKISVEDFPKIEAEMQKIIKENLPLVHSEVSLGEARKIFKDNGYKLEWINRAQKKGEKISLYSTGADFTDLCAGPHVKSTGEIKAFKLLRIAGAYWHGDENNKMLTRIYGTAWTTKEELENYLKTLEEAENKDHRKIGKDLGLFVFSDLVGKGLPLLTAKGATIRRELERFVVDEEIKRGYQHVVTPPLANLDLYRTSGHYPYYKDTMYPPMTVDEEELMLRPMTCPHHFMLYKSEQHSYRELPVRIAEISPQFRYEKSGELSGLLRVRMFTLADAHIICSSDQAKQVIGEVLDLIDYINGVLGMKLGTDYHYRLSLGDRSDDKKYFKDDKAWDVAEKVLKDVLVERKAAYFEGPNEAAFYGPKIDVQVKNAHGKEETAFTVQYDFVMPKRFGLTYVNKDGKENQPIVIHRSSIGAFERSMAFLIEKFGGAFPTWLSPVQVVVLPIADRHLEYAKGVFDELKKSDVRVELDDRQETLSAKIRDAQIQKVPYMLVVGDKEVETGMVTERARSGKADGPFTVETFIKNIREEIDKKICT